MTCIFLTFWHNFFHKLNQNDWFGTGTVVHSSREVEPALNYSLPQFKPNSARFHALNRFLEPIVIFDPHYKISLGWEGREKNLRTPAPEKGASAWPLPSFSVPDRPTAPGSWESCKVVCFAVMTSPHHHRRSHLTRDVPHCSSPQINTCISHALERI